MEGQTRANQDEYAASPGMLSRGTDIPGQGTCYPQFSDMWGYLYVDHARGHHPAGRA